MHSSCELNSTRKHIALEDAVWLLLSRSQARLNCMLCAGALQRKARGAIHLWVATAYPSWQNLDWSAPDVQQQVLSRALLTCKSHLLSKACILGVGQPGAPESSSISLGTIACNALPATEQMHQKLQFPIALFLDCFQSLAAKLLLWLH